MTSAQNFLVELKQLQTLFKKSTLCLRCNQRLGGSDKYKKFDCNEKKDYQPMRIYKSIYCQKEFKNNCTLSQFTFTQEAQFPKMVLLSSESYNIIS